MIVDVVSTKTEDGIRLYGMLREPSPGAKNELPIDVLICHHGVAGNFYGSGMYDDFSDMMAEAGLAVLRVNNRGHDPVSWAVSSTGQTRMGAAYEIMEECTYDWDAWISFAAEQGYERIGVMGHSLGATKTIYYFGNRTDERVKLAIAASPPRLSYSAFLKDPTANQLKEYVQAAKAKIDAGDPKGLIDAKLPVPFLGAAATYYEKYGPDEKVNILRHLPNVKLPLLAFHGTQEPAAELPMRGVLEELPAIAAAMPNFTHVTIPEGDHFYTGVRPHVWGVIRDWLKAQD